MARLASRCPASPRWGLHTASLARWTVALLLLPAAEAGGGRGKFGAYRGGGGSSSRKSWEENSDRRAHQHKKDTRANYQPSRMSIASFTDKIADLKSITIDAYKKAPHAETHIRTEQPTPPHPPLHPDPALSLR